MLHRLGLAALVLTFGCAGKERARREATEARAVLLQSSMELTKVRSALARCRDVPYDATTPPDFSRGQEHSKGEWQFIAMQYRLLEGGVRSELELATAQLDACERQLHSDPDASSQGTREVGDAGPGTPSAEQARVVGEVLGGAQAVCGARFDDALDLGPVEVGLSLAVQLRGGVLTGALDSVQAKAVGRWTVPMTQADHGIVESACVDVLVPLVEQALRREGLLGRDFVATYDAVVITDSDPNDL